MKEAQREGPKIFKEMVNSFMEPFFTKKDFSFIY